jgi:hypothetical protein
MREKFGNFPTDRIPCKSAEAITIACRKDFDEKILMMRKS